MTETQKNTLHILMHCSTAQHTATGSRTSAKPQFFENADEKILCATSTASSLTRCTIGILKLPTDHVQPEVPSWLLICKEPHGPDLSDLGLKIEGKKKTELMADHHYSHESCHKLPASSIRESNCGTFRHFMEVEHSMY